MHPIWFLWKYYKKIRYIIFAWRWTEPNPVRYSYVANLPIPVLPPPSPTIRAVSSIEGTHAEINRPPVLT